MTKGTIRSLRERPLAVIGAVGRCIDLTGDSRVSTRLGGLGYDVVLGVDRAGGSCRAMLLASANVTLAKFGSVERRRLTVSVSQSKEEFEFVHHCASMAITALRSPGVVQINELRTIISAARVAIRGSHVHYAGIAVLAGSPGIKQPTSSSVSVSCEELRKLNDSQIDGLPNLIFLNGSCGNTTQSCPAFRAVQASRAVVHNDGGVGVTVIVDGIPTVSFGLEHDVQQWSGADFGIFVGSTLVGLGNGLSLEESVATSALLGQASSNSLLPYAVRSLDVDARASRVMNLMTTSPIARNADRYRTAVALLVVRDGLLLVGSKPVEKAFVPGRLYLPGGKLEEGETPSQAARRELFEETGLTVETLELCGFSCYEKNGQLYEFAQYIATAKGDPVPKDDMESLEWWAIDDLQRQSVFDLTWAQLYLLRDDGSLT
jgi:8-oxo-dGTP pyrophosphatase MutT (NUDIX family)